ncbi:MAG TPA: ABC transporter permease [candidate division Zixibacteria bacterium]|nr:ABC transporter permease [candidate division Zixibacteria bacterium]
MFIFKFFHDWIKHFVVEIQRLFFFSIRMTLALFGRPIYPAETFEQMYLIGVGSLFLVILTGMSAGQAMALEFANELADFGSKNYLGRVMILAIVRELGPILTGIMVASRVAAGITSEIGAMKSSKQLDALVAFGIDPMRKLAAPRLISLLIMVPALTIVCDIISLIGGWMVSVFIAHITSLTYWTAVRQKLMFGNIFIGLFKPFVFALIIGYISCYKGFTSAGGTKGVGRATTESVMISSITILISNFIITKFFSGFLKAYL